MRRHFPAIFLIMAFMSLSRVIPVSVAEEADGIASKVKPQPAELNEGVVLDKETQSLAGIQVQTAQISRYQPEYVANAQVISIAPLLALRERYLVAKSELVAAQARMRQTSQNAKRQQALFRDGITAKRSLQAHETAGLADKAAVEAAQVKLTALANETRLRWGAILADWALSQVSGKLEAFLAGKRALLQLSLPSSKQLSDQIAGLPVNAHGQRDNATLATMISRAPQADQNTQGQSYFLALDTDSLSPGMKVTAWLPEANAGLLPESGFFVPESAIVWNLDQAYVYIKASPEHFTRRAISTGTAMQSGHFIKDGIVEGEEIVTSGAQTLLSHELKSQVPSED